MEFKINQNNGARMVDDVLTLLVPCCAVCYHFHVKTLSISYNRLTITRVKSWCRNVIPFRSTLIHPKFLWFWCYIIRIYLCNVFQIIVFPFSFGHCIISSSIYSFLLLLWYILETFLQLTCHLHNILSKQMFGTLLGVLKTQLMYAVINKI